MRNNFPCIGKRKTFDKQLHKNNDPESRRVVKQYMSSLGFIFRESDNDYTIDLVGENVSFNLELERRWQWVGGKWSYPTVHIPARKQGTLQDRKTCYVVVSRNWDYLGICHSDKLHKYLDKVTEVPNSAVHSGEYFYNIPTDEFVWVKIK